MQRFIWLWRLHTFYSKEKHKAGHPVSHHFKIAVNYCTYRLTSTLPKYLQVGSKWIVNIEKKMTAHMKSQTFSALDPISTTGLLVNFELACDIDKIHENAALFLIHLCTIKTASAALIARLGAQRSDSNPS